MKDVPHFDLYGSLEQPAWRGLVHVERIPDRAARHDWQISPHVHDVLTQVLFVQAGGGRAVIEKAIWALKPPCLVVVPAGSVHGFRFLPGTDGAVITAAQRPLESAAAAFAPGLLHAMRRPAVISVDSGARHAEALLPLIDATAREARVHAPGEAAAGMALLVALFVQVARLSGGAAGGGDALAHSRKAARIERFQALLDAGFKARWPVQHYASELGVTPGQLTRLCREWLGMSSLEVINRRVLHEAQRQLVYASLSIKQIAAELGFADEAYFGRFFRKQTGQTPTAFRSAARSALAGS